ncbi:MAG: alkaline shock response membrane anchor protein AmaP [Clostridia bacterium]|nr:alkaline shock response membrane anchor protein AmaP [Clostridia bacterium]
MKGFEKFLLVLFSIIIIALSVILILMSTEMIKVANIFNPVVSVLVGNKILFLVIGAIFALLGLVGVFSNAENSDDMKSGLAIKTEKGTVYITRDTFESIILGVTKSYAELKNVRAEISVSETGVIANIYTMILPDTVVPTLTAKLQENIKTSVLKQTTVEIKEANIKIRGVYMEPQKK